MARSRTKSRRRTGGHPARHTPVQRRRSPDGHGEMVLNGMRLRGAIGELADGYVELLFAAPVNEDSWTACEQSVNGEVDIAGAIAVLREPVALAALRNACAGFGVPWAEVEDDPSHIRHIQARALSSVTHAVGEDQALSFLASIPTDELKALRVGKAA